MVLRGVLKFLVGFFALVLILGAILAGVAYFALRNLDPNMFRAEVEKQLTAQTGFRVELGDIRLRWSPRPQLQISGIKLYQPETLEMILRSDQLQVDANLPSALQKQFKVSQILVRSPEIFVKHNSDGAWNWEALKNFEARVPSQVSMEGFIPVAEASEGSGEGSPTGLPYIAQGWKVEIGKILVRDGTIRFADETAQPVFQTEIDHLDAEIRQQDAPDIFHVAATAAVLDSSKRNLEADGNLDLGRRALEMTLRYGAGTALLQGRLEEFDESPRFEGKLEVRDLDLESVTPAVYKEKEYVSGRLGVVAQISFDGSNPETLKRSLRGQGIVTIADGALKNRNLVREIFDRLSSVVAITSTLDGELPPELDEMLRGRDTPFQSLAITCEAQDGIAKVREFSVQHPDYLFAGQGTYGILDKRVDGAMQLLLSQPISAYLIKKIHEMQMIADRNGRVMIPFRYAGIYPDAVVQPDIGYVGAQLLQQGTDALITKGLEHLSKYLEKKTKQ